LKDKEELKKKRRRRSKTRRCWRWYNNK
jgi:hypothetical protein